jgi:lipoprotein-anchoring transpeptidase ErfK/SrfK
MSSNGLRHAGIAALVGLAPLSVGCSGGASDGAAPTLASAVATQPPTMSPPHTGPQLELEPATSLAAEAVVDRLTVYDDAGLTSPSTTLDNPTEVGAPLVLLVKSGPTGGSALEVYLPVRPNGSSGWVSASEVQVRSNPYRIEIDLSDFRLRLFEDDREVLSEAVGLGRADVPTPGGVFYIKELLQPPDPDGPYGPYAYGLSGFSNVLTSFAGGDGVIGIHGTDDPSSIGVASSHGCIRLPNEVITRLVGILPLGTPVEILN